MNLLIILALCVAFTTAQFGEAVQQLKSQTLDQSQIQSLSVGFGRISDFVVGRGRTYNATFNQGRLGD